MSTERRFTEEEIAVIFEDATEAHKQRQQARLHTDGLTLAELQKIGNELGLPADIIAQSATKLSRPAGMNLYDYQPSKILGVEVSAGQSFELPTPLSDENWDKLVVDLRHVFKSQGEVKWSGSLREWKTDNDIVTVTAEPTDSGQRLRINIENENVQAGLIFGAAMTAILSLFLLAVMFKTGDHTTAQMVVSTLLILSLGLAGISPRFMPKWKKVQNKQMNDIGARALELVESQSANNATEIATTITAKNLAEPTPLPQVSLDDLPEMQSPTADNPVKSKNRA